MSSTTVVIEHSSLEFELSVAEGLAHLGQTSRQAFPDIERRLFVDARQTLLNAINWAWLKWCERRDRAEVVLPLEDVVRRGIELDRHLDVGGMQSGRAEHDVFLLHCAILTGNHELMHLAAEVARPAESEGEQLAYDAAWAGMLKFRILRDEPRVQGQREIMGRCKPLRIFQWPGKKLCDGFAQKDTIAFRGAIRESIRKWWNTARDRGAILEQGNGTKIVNLRKMHIHYFWPYPEAAFIRLMMNEAMGVVHDDFWLPEEFLRPR